MPLSPGVNVRALRQDVINMRGHIAHSLAEPRNRAKLPDYPADSRERAIQLETLAAIGCRAIVEGETLFALKQVETQFVARREQAIAETLAYIAEAEAPFAALSRAQSATITEAA